MPSAWIVFVLLVWRSWRMQVAAAMPEPVAPVCAPEPEMLQQSALLLS